MTFKSVEIKVLIESSINIYFTPFPRRQHPCPDWGAKKDRQTPESLLQPDIAPEGRGSLTPWGSLLLSQAPAHSIMHSLIH